MLFDPFKEQFHLPPPPVQRADGVRGEFKIIGEEEERVALRGIVDMHPAQRPGKLHQPGEFAGQDNGLITAQAGGFICGAGRSHPEVQAHLGPDHEADASVVELCQPGKIQISAI